jgi:phage N-6-adenine-methyltransferase
MGLTGRPLTYHPDRPSTNAERWQRFKAKRAAELAQLRRTAQQRAYHQRLRDDYETPWHVFAPYNDEFAFTLDVCALPTTRKCARYFSPAEDGLAQDWGTEICWMNPPYGMKKGEKIADWMEKAYRSSLAGATVCAFIPSRTGTRWWHAWVLGKGEIRYRQGRTTFVGAPDPAGFDSVAVIYRPPSTP